MKIKIDYIVYLAIVLLLIIILFTNNCKCEIQAVTYTHNNTIQYTDFNSLTEEYCHVYLYENPDRKKDFYTEHNLNQYCK